LLEQRSTYLMVTPSPRPLLLRVLRDPGFACPDLAHVRVGAFGGSPVPLSTVAGLRRAMPQLRLYDAYGLSETHSPATILLDAEFERKPGSIGRPVPCCDVHIVDPDGSDLPTGLDRIKDVVIRGGYKVYSVELEYLLVSHPRIEQAAVFGVPDKIAYEAVACYITATAGETVTAVVVRTFVHERMADYAVPRHVRIVDETPRNKTGKIEKDLLRGLLTAELQAQQH